MKVIVNNDGSGFAEMGKINKPITKFKIRFVTEMHNLFAMKAHNRRA